MFFFISVRILPPYFFFVLSGTSGLGVENCFFSLFRVCHRVPEVVSIFDVKSYLVYLFFLIFNILATRITFIYFLRVSPSWLACRFTFYDAVVMSCFFCFVNLFRSWEYICVTRYLDFVNSLG